MFVRYRDDERGILHLTLVEARRIDGKPRQRHVCELGLIRRDANLGGRYEFWCDVQTDLDDYVTDEAERRKLATHIAERVPRPTSEQYTTWFDERVRILDAEAEQLGKLRAEAARIQEETQRALDAHERAYT